MRILARAAALCAVVIVSGCAARPSAPALPPTEGVFDYQLGGSDARLDDGTPIHVVVRDATSDPLEGAYNVCYVNGFQTQPGDDAAWAERAGALLRDVDGEPVVDPAWPDEVVLDPSTAEARDAILAVTEPVIARCADAGFDAVEIDNLDTWTRFPRIDEGGAMALAEDYVAAAHGRGLAVAQKNAASIASRAHDELGFDFAITEECGAYDECGEYASVYGDHVLQIEYRDTLDEAGISFAEVCASDHRAPLTILRDRDLAPVGDPGHVHEAC